jgi:AbrB family looped-hinge helix DNA binding protein
MENVIISSKYQVVIPRKVRESMKLMPGQKMQVIAYGDRVELVPQKKISAMRGFLKGINTDFEREDDRL